jgi:homoserine kinase
MICVRVPATTANLGPGFDCLGMALSLYNRIYFQESGTGLRINGCDRMYAGEENLAYVAYLRTLEKHGIEKPSGLEIEIVGEIPISRGLGSSATMIVGGIMGAAKVHGLDLSREDMLLIANEIEGHPDNVAPAIYGGLTAAVVRDGDPVVMRYPVSETLRFAALVPEFETSTQEARAILPDMIKRTDGVYTAGCLSVLLKAMETGDRKALSVALDDRLHQPYRKTLIPGYDGIKKLAIENGAAGLVISGSGSTLLAVGIEGDFKDRMKEALKSFDGNWQIMNLSVDTEGAKLIV